MSANLVSGPHGRADVVRSRFRRGTRWLVLGAALFGSVAISAAARLAVPPAAAATAYPDAAGEPVPFGGAGYFGSPAGLKLSAPVVAIAPVAGRTGYWLDAADGGVFSYGGARFFGSMGGHPLNQPIIGMASTPDGNGYWQVTRDGGIFSFGDARFHGSTGGVRLVQPIVGMSVDPATGGYWLVASDGGVFSFDAPFFGSMGGRPLNQPVVGMASTPDGKGYWLVARDGGIFSFGDARFHGSTGGVRLVRPIVGMAVDPATGGYWMAASDGGVFSFDAPFHGSMGGQALQNPVAAIASGPGGAGYWLLPTTPPPPPPGATVTGTLNPGATGAEVVALQERLNALGYWVGPPDGSFGDSTEQAVYALQKAAGLTPDGVVGPETEAALTKGVLPVPRSTSGYVIEVNLQNDIVMFVTDGRIDHVLNTSTGGGYTYTDDGVTTVAQTPVGQFQIYREVDGLVVDSLGALWRPKFFDGGFAVHGDSSVPPYPVSHGCVRVSNEAIDWIWANDLAPIGTEVWVY